MNGVGAVLLVLAAVGVCAVGPWSATRRVRGFGRPVTCRVRGRRATARRAESVAATDLLAACLTAGATPIRAAEVAAAVLDGAVAFALRAAVRAAARGAGPEECWSKLAAIPELDTVGRILARAAVCGTRAADAMAAEAAAMRLRNSAAGQAAVTRVGVWAVAPLALCFLPAFLFLGVVPIALGLAPLMAH
ncbi:MAG TPA: type II secretion system F family protein [Sporichthyaceae bacterium]|nr:type II secretion system F family protein [Sporichthyaceae bacterium]